MEALKLDELSDEVKRVPTRITEHIIELKDELLQSLTTILQVIKHQCFLPQTASEYFTQFNHPIVSSSKCSIPFTIVRPDVGTPPYMACIRADWFERGIGAGLLEARYTFIKLVNRYAIQGRRTYHFAPYETGEATAHLLWHLVKASSGMNLNWRPQDVRDYVEQELKGVETRSTTMDPAKETRRDSSPRKFKFHPADYLQDL